MVIRVICRLPSDPPQPLREVLDQPVEHGHDDALAHRRGLAGDLGGGVDGAAAVVEIDGDVGVRVALAADLARLDLQQGAVRSVVLLDHLHRPGEGHRHRAHLDLDLGLRRGRARALDDLAALHARDQAVEVEDRLPDVVGRLAGREGMVELNHGDLSLRSCGSWSCPDQSTGSFASTSTSTSSATFRVPNSAENGLMPQSLCLKRMLPVRRPSSPASRSNATGRVAPSRSRSPWTRSPPGAASTALERNAIVPPFSTSSSIDCAMLVFSSSPSEPMPPLPERTASDRASAVSATLPPPPSPTSSAASHRVTSMTRLWPAFAAAPAFPVRTVSVP